MIQGKKFLYAFFISCVCGFLLCWNHWRVLRTQRETTISFNTDENEKCVTGTPCVYVDEVDFRIIVITFNRANSLLKLLKSIDDIELDGSQGALEI